MLKNISLTLLMLFLLTACAPRSEASPPGTPAISAVPTLPATQSGSATPTEIPPSALPASESSPTNAPSACKYSAVLVEDVNYPDNTRVTAGEKFTKTWRLRNTGDCPWKGYTVAFVSGERMDAPDAIPVPETPVNSTVDISVDLSAPATDGPYTGNFELRGPDGKPIPMGTEPTFWVKIIVGNAEDPLGVQQRIGNCAYAENPEYVQAMIDLVNKTRADAGLKALTVNDRLTIAAQSHSLDMACNSTKFLLHSGSDGLYTGERLAKVGYTNPYYFELLGIGLAQDAMNEWRRHEDTWPAVIDPYVTEIGVGYAYSKSSTYGGYWTVLVGGPK